MNSKSCRSPLVSVIIPAFNVEEVIEGSVRSALEQSIQDIEVIVVDDASVDETRGIVASLAAQDQRVRLIESPTNAGPGAARSQGLTEAQGVWIAVLDADDRFKPDRLEMLVAIGEDSNLDAIADNLLLMDPFTQAPTGTGFPMQPEEYLTLTPEVFLNHSVPAGRVNLGWCQPVIRRSFLEHNTITWRPFRHAEDFLFAMEILLTGAKFRVVGYPGYAYTQRRGAASGKRSPHSRTSRSVSEQHAAMDELFTRHAASISPVLRGRLLKMRRQISVASHLLDLRDGIDDKNIYRMISALRAALTHPQTLLSCVVARYGPKSNKILEAVAGPE